MAIKPSIVSTANLDEAAGNNPALRAMLEQIASAQNKQATQTNTSGKTPPNQSTAKVAFQNPFYIVTMVDPNGQAALSLAQQPASTLGGNSTLSNIFHQVQAATSILFDAPANLKTYGGDTGNLQTQFIIGDLDTTKSWYFRFRTSYDGQNWNQWKTINPKSTSVNPNAVTLVSVAGGQWAGVTLPGGQSIGFGIGQLNSGDEIQTSGGALINTALGVTTPATYINGPVPAYGVTTNNIDATGIISLVYTGKLGATWSGRANFLTFGWDPNGAQKVTAQTLADGGHWVVLTLAGGARIAIGTGTAANGATIDYPAGFTGPNSFGVVTPRLVNATMGYAHGIRQADLVNGLVTCLYDSVDGTSTSTANWFALAWEPSLNANKVAVAGGTYLRLPTPSGDVMVGVGQTPNGSYLPLPAGYSYSKCLAFPTAGTNTPTATGTVMHGVMLCTIDAGLSSSNGLVSLYYTDGGPPWDGNANWFSICWP